MKEYGGNFANVYIMTQTEGSILVKIVNYIPGRFSL